MPACPRTRITAIAPTEIFYLAGTRIATHTCVDGGWGGCGAARTMRAPDAVVVGSGPNGLAGALTLGEAGLAVDVIEGAPTQGGGCRTEELTVAGFRHDVCSAAHPLVAASRFFRSTVESGRITLLQPDVAFAHPLEGGACRDRERGRGRDSA